MRHKPLIILAVGPSPFFCKAALEAHGLDPVSAGPGLRMVTRAPALRGWSHGTPVAAFAIHDWPHCSQAAADLAACLLAMLGTGQLRLLQDEDIAALRAEAA